MTIYGFQPDNEIFSVVTCYSCGMVLKPSSLNYHMKKRHSVNSLSENSNIFVESEIEPVIEHKVKRPKIEKDIIMITREIDNRIKEDFSQISLSPNLQDCT